ncbi:MAG: hypothetical protein WAM97_05545 [Acidimicrobiales bacterium]
MRLLRENKRASLLAILTALALMVSFVVVQSEFSTGAQNQTMQPGTALDVLCSGSSLTSSATSATSVNLDCLRKAPKVPVPVGHATRFDAASTARPFTSLPAGTSVGDVLISFVESYSFSSINCVSGFTRVLDKAGRGGSRIVACETVVKKGQRDPAAQISPPTQVTMVTMAFSGVSTTNPIDASAVAGGTLSPGVTTDTAGTELIFGEGSDGWGIVPKAPVGSTLGATVNDFGDSQAAIATEASNTAGPTLAADWTHLSARNAVSATIALRPATSTSQGSNSANVASGPPSVQMTPNTTMSVSCEGPSITVTGMGPTTVLLSCLAAAPIAQIGTSTTFASQSSGSPTTPLPTGTQPGDVLVSYIESYSFTSINCDSGWTLTLDAKNGEGARLAACVAVDSDGQTAPVDKVSPPTQVSMVTTAFSGVNNTNPVAAAAADPGATSPGVTSNTPGTALVFGE